MKLVRLASPVASLSIAAIIGSAGVATADTDSYTYDHVEVGAQNNGGSPTAWICNEQSSANDFKFWVHSAYFGNLRLTPGTEWLLVQLGNNVYEVSLNAGECKWVYTGAPVTVQVYAGSGSLSWGTNPIAWSP